MAAKKLPATTVWAPPIWDNADAGSLQALARGDADEHAQRRALKFIVEELAGTYEVSYRPGVDGERDTAFHEGRRYVGLNIVKLVKINLSQLRKKDNG